MTCPRCGGPTRLTDRSRHLRVVVSGSVLREHRCPACRSTFVTEQAVVTPERAEDLIDVAGTQPWTGSGGMPSSAA